MSNKFNPMKARFRASFAAGIVNEPRLGQIDKEAEVLHDVQITLEGEARGHGVFLDRDFCEAVAAAGNEAGEAGVKVRFGHPAMCSDALGTYLGRAKNFRVVDVTRKETNEKAAGVLADIHIAAESHSAPSGDLGKWVMEAAENSPDTFGQSIVFTYADLRYFDVEKNEYVYCSKSESFWDDIGDRKCFAVLGKLLGTDFTDTPAATDGVFSANDLASEAEEMLAEHPEISEAILGKPEKVVEFLDRMGLLKSLETARVSGLQAAKDKQIAELKEMHKKNDADAVAAMMERDQFKADLDAAKVELEALKAENENLKAEITEKTGALDKAAAEVEQLKSKLGETETALAKSQAALEVEIQRYREQVGAAMHQPEGVKDDSWAAKYRQARRA